MYLWMCCWEVHPTLLCRQLHKRYRWRQHARINYRLVPNHNAAHRQQLLDRSVPEREAEIEVDRVVDYRGRRR